MLGLLFALVLVSVKANSPPRFLLDNNVGSEIVLRLQEGETKNSSILRLRGYDADGDSLTFGVLGAGKDLVTIVSRDSYSADVYLTRALDHELSTEHFLLISLTDGHLGQENFITQPLLILVEDSNDNKPVFVELPGAVRVTEHELPTQKIIAEFKATDKDSGAFGQVVYNLAPNQESDIYEHFSVSTIKDKGVLKLESELDYEEKHLYQVLVEASDRASLGQTNTVQATVIIEVEDIGDQPPEWVSVPAVTRIQEDVPLFTPVRNSVSSSPAHRVYYKHVLQVKAIDGDRNINNEIEYEITSGPEHVFGVNKNTGTIYSKAIIDRESSYATYGTFILGLTATEINKDGSRGQSVTTEVTIIVSDVNDEIPKFRAQEYVGEIVENSQKNTPITMLGENVLAEVFDYDQGTNGTFELILDDPTDTFEVTPKVGINEASFMIRVKNPSNLDFEKVRLFNLSLMAKEVVKGGRETRVPVTVYVRDQNDNRPMFSLSKYEVWIKENLSSGDGIINISGTDLDSGVYGTPGVMFTGLQGSISKHLQLNNRTGAITMGNTEEFNFDRELTDTHYLTVEIKDDNGNGNTNTAELIIHVIDTNDNAPIFTADQYQSFLLENSPQFKVPLLVKAVDADQSGTENAEVRYMIVNGDPGGNFTINSTTGEVKPTGVLDYELLPGSNQGKTYNLTIRAFDLGSPSLSADVSVVIYLIDQNDNPPLFSKMQYAISIPEDTPGLTPVIKVEATDGDGSSPNNQIVYRIQSGAKDKFVINAETGIISVSEGANLDPDLSSPSTTEYLLEVVALDGGVGSEKLTGWTRVVINISDVNNKLPKFSKMKHSFVPENASVGGRIGQLKAVDHDHTARLRYGINWNQSKAKDEDGRSVSFKDYDWRQTFDVKDKTGEVFLSKPLDREIIQDYLLIVFVEDISADGERQLANTQIEITIQDINDNSPVFSSSEYYGTVQENSQRGTGILKVLARDPDINKTINYSIQGNEKQPRLLTIDKDTGEIKVFGSIDREKFAWLNFTVAATDNGWPQRTSYANVYIKVLDENDNSPVLDAKSLHFQVREDAEMGEVIAKIHATDADEGEYGKVTYAIDNKDGTDSGFKIDPNTGEITLAQKLDREESSKHSVLVQAWDNYQHGYSAGQSRNTWAQLTIIVTDVNDEAPEFVENDQSCVTISEFQKKNEPITTVRAVDKDDPESANSEIFFDMNQSEVKSLFRLETYGKGVAKIFPSTSLKGKYGNYSIRITAQDGGNPPNVKSSTYNICIQDFNDNAPEFIFPPSNYTVRVSENANVGTEVITIKAVDTDIGSNGLVKYSIRKDPLGNYKAFKIDQNTGVITLLKPLDRERQKIYELRIEAHDEGVPTPLQSDLDLTIYVKNVNDHQPQFIVDEYKVNFTENKPGGSERRRIINTVDLDDVDEDEVKTDVCYFIVGGEDASMFNLNPFSHEIMAVNALDREEKDLYKLIIKATEECHQKPPSTSKFNPSDDSLLQLIIQIDDQNDNAPKFTQKVFTGGISTDIDYGTSFMQAFAEDKDDGIHAKLEYFICSPITPILYEGAELDSSSAFAMDPVTGEVQLNFDPQRNQKGYFEFDVCVRDIGGNNDTAKVYIYLLREDQRVKFVVRNHPDEIRARLQEFRGVLSEITSSIVNVDQIKVHENSDGSVDKTKTDVLLHFVKGDDNTIIEALDVIQNLDYNTEQLDPFFKEYNVLQTETANASALASKQSNPKMMIVFWLIGLCVFLSITLAVVLCVCVSQRFRYNRKLKAATTAAFGTQAASDIIVKHEAVVPNTNRHAVEGSNPVWMTGVGYDNWAVEGEDDDGISNDDLKQPHFNNFDSLDANVLNDSYEEEDDDAKENQNNNHEDLEDDIEVPDHLRGDVLYSRSYHSGGGSTLLMSSSTKDLSNDGESHSSGRGSGSRVGSAYDTRNKYGSINRNLSALFPAGMPPVEKLQNPLASSRLTLNGYEDVSIPRTEL